MPYSKLIQAVMKFCNDVEHLRTPETVLHSLNDAVSKITPVSVLGAVRLPIKVTDLDALILGKSVFVLEKIDYWREYSLLVPELGDPKVMMARLSIAPYTWTETAKALELVAADRWAYEVALKHGIRDGFTCPIGSRWVVGYWSKKVLANLPLESRALLFLAASFAAIRMEKVAEADAKRMGMTPLLSPRELAVLRLLSIGKRTSAIAHRLSVGEETVRTHIKRAQAKLGVATTTQAVAEAMRQRVLS
jgi:DNA-binding CsgD family transcriptional regulator